MQGTISRLVTSYGYVVLFFLVGAESLGIPLPGETAVVTAAAWAALGDLSVYAVVATAAAGASGSGRAQRRSFSAGSLRYCAPGPPCSRERHACRTAPSCSITRSEQ